jgi:hypothetical protein
MAWKIYKSGSFLVCENATTGDLKEFRSVDAQITKKKAGLDEYELVVDGAVELRLNLSEIQDANGDAYVEAVWDAFRYEQLGVDTDAAAVQSFAGLSDVTFGTPTDGQAFVWDSGTSKVVPATVGDGYTETIVNISSAQILAMGTSPIELLPAAGANSYYEVDKIRFEYSHNTTAYTIANRLYVYGGDIYVVIKNSFIADGSDYVGSVVPSPSMVDTVPVFQLENGLNTSLVFSVEGGVDPTAGDGTLRAIITYTLRTFGA